MTPRLTTEPRFSLYAGLAVWALALAGCSSSSEQHVIAVAAVTAPDSVGAGQPLLVKVTWVATDACEKFDEIHARRENDTTYVITPLAHRSGTICATVMTVGESSVRINTPPGRSFLVAVAQPSRNFVLPVQGGAQPANIERHRIELENAATGAPLPNEPVTLLGSVATDTLAKVTTGSGGAADTAFGCLVAGRPYQLLLNGSPPLPFSTYPARCGAPERTVVRLTRP
jgi:hypothetical protein